MKADPSLSHPASDLLHIQHFTTEGMYEGLGVPLGTDAFVQNFVKDKCLGTCMTCMYVCMYIYVPIYLPMYLPTYPFLQSSELRELDRGSPLARAENICIRQTITTVSLESAPPGKQ